MRGPWSTLALFVALIGLGSYIYFVDSKRDPSNEGSSTREKAFAVEASKLQEVHLRLATGVSSALKKADGKWQLTAPEPAQADEAETSGIASNLAPLESTFNRTPFDLRDKTILAFERDKIDGVELSNSTGQIQMARASSNWSLVRPVAARGDYGTIEGLMGQLQSARLKAIVAPQTGTLQTYGLDKPAVSVTLVAGSARATLVLGKSAPDNTVYARDVSRPMVFTVETALADQLRKAAVEYRRKDTFEFRPFNATQIAIARGNDTVSFERTKGQGADAQDTWRETAPTARDVDASKIDALLTKLSSLRAQSFVDAKTATGLSAPLAVVTVHYDVGAKQERVSIGRTGTETYAARDDEPGAGRIDTTEVDATLKALDALK